MSLLRIVTLALLLAGVLALVGCGDFFVSQSTIDTVSFTPNAVILKSGEFITLTPVVTTVGGQQTNPTSGVTWTSSNDSIATVDATGKLTAGNTAGIATITAAYSSKKGSGTMIVTVGTVPSTINVNGSTSLLLSSPNYQYTATATLNGNPNFDLTPYATWTSQDNTIASVSSTGMVTAKSTCSSFGVACPKITASISTSSTTLTNSQQISSIQ